MGRQWEKRIPCTDGTGRPRDVTVYVTDEGVIGITVPPGETAVLPATGDTTGRLRDALAEAQVVQRGLS